MTPDNDRSDSGGERPDSGDDGSGNDSDANELDLGRLLADTDSEESEDDRASVG
jgi:hypothetical protein